MTTPNIDTKALRELEAKATPAPWESSYFGDGQFVVRMPRDRSLRFHPRPPSGGDSLAATVYGAPGFAKLLPGDVVVGMSGHELDGLTEQEYANQRVADGQLIVALRNAAPALLDLADRAQEDRGSFDIALERNALSKTLSDTEAELVEVKTERVKLLAERDALKAEVATLKANAQNAARLAHEDRAKLSASEREADRLRAVILWALGENGDFRTREDGEGAYWWRKELRKRAALRGEATAVEWSDGRTLRLDDSVLFGKGCDLEGLDCLSQEAVGPDGRYIVWKTMGRPLWSFYRESDGLLAFERYSTEQDVKAECERMMRAPANVALRGEEAPRG